MNARWPVCVMISLILSACTAQVTQTPAPPPTPVTPSLTVQETPTVVFLTATLETTMPETATVPVTEQTATTQPSETSQPTATSGMVIATVDEGSSAGEPSPPPMPCQRPQNWVQYTVQRNDTLSSLGQRTGVGWQQIQAANCLAGVTIFAGQALYLPFIPQAPVVTHPPIADTLPAPGPGDPALVVNPESGPPGTQFTISIEDFEPNQTITVRVLYVPSFKVVYEQQSNVDAAGNRVEYYLSPADALSGDYTVSAFGAGKAASDDFTITAP